VRQGPAATPTGRAGRAAAASSRPVPEAPWAPFPLIELAILIAIGLVVAGFLTRGPRGPILLGCGLGLATLATLELTIREHLAGYRSHATLLAGAGAVAVAALLFAFTRLPQPAPLVIAAAVFGTLWSVLRAAFRRARTEPPAPG
ncbi:MAG: hypothetical protein ACR2KV_08740, partial [Solirubrobacteraceae bacterium]